MQHHPLGRAGQFALGIAQRAVQAAAALLVLSLAWPYYGFVGRPYDWPVVCILIGIVASVIVAVYSDRLAHRQRAGGCGRGARVATARHDEFALNLAHVEARYDSSLARICSADCSSTV